MKRRWQQARRGHSRCANTSATTSCCEQLRPTPSHPPAVSSAAVLGHRPTISPPFTSASAVAPASPPPPRGSSAVQQALVFRPQLRPDAWRHVSCAEDGEALRDSLPQLGLVAFVADSAVLPRASGADDRPMAASAAVKFRAPDSMAVEVTLPHAGRVRGLGVRRGVTLIVGGGFHGKSTLLEAIEAGVYNKIPGDGRELVVTVPDAVKVRAEDGRRVECVDVSPFITNLPLGRHTTEFRTDDASGSTSQAAAIQEALELGSSCLLLDEDSCAANLMVRDSAMAALIPAAKEPITTFRARISALRARGVSSVLVMGGCGDYFAAADAVIAMDAFQPADVTSAAKDIAGKLGGSGAADDASEYGRVAQRLPLSLYPHDREPGGRALRAVARGLHALQFGDQQVELAALAQLVDVSQTRAVAAVLPWLHARLAAGGSRGGGEGRAMGSGDQGAGAGGLRRSSLLELLQELEALFDSQGLDVLAPHLHLGDLARPRRFEVGAAINRLRTLRAAQR